MVAADTIRALKCVLLSAKILLYDFCTVPIPKILFVNYHSADQRTDSNPTQQPRGQCEDWGLMECSSYAMQLHFLKLVDFGSF